ncbi:uncharacterized protein LY79DRAFT_578372 [Colletotrichum navitas]|uniref:Uncharacterized protein n=1 Tax=Colletotrichum navitas TaxID=681940 RepID=A0AAD8Q2W6_9PEZI|nr:uncharacterized protein LY79DRAFT_578372 [Colletotrichum navitas]KAK1594773.1 hypothetical protein LY79DRAFT_578372 [Colletotrichum navitas]
MWDTQVSETWVPSLPTRCGACCTFARYLFTGAAQVHVVSLSAASSSAALLPTKCSVQAFDWLPIHAAPAAYGCSFHFVIPFITRYAAVRYETVYATDNLQLPIVRSPSYFIA